MISRRIFAALAALCFSWLILGGSIAHATCTAPCTKAQIAADVAVNFPDNMTGAITPAIVRASVLEIVNSYVDANGGTSLSCAAHQWVAAIPTLSSITCTQPAIADVSGWGAGVATALGVATNTAGGPAVPSAALTANGVVYGGGSGVSPGSTAAGTNGQLFLGVTSGAPQWGMMSGDVAITNAGVATIQAAGVTNAKLANMNAWTIKGNGTSGAIAPTDFTIDGLTLKASPAAGDEVWIWDVSGAAWKKTTASALSTVGNVASWDNMTGSITSVIPAQGRLTLASHTPVMVASQTSQTTLYYDSYVGNQVMYYTGSVDAVDTITSNEVSIALQSSGTGILGANNVFDVWWEGNTNHKPCVATNGSGGGGAGWAGDTGGSNSARGTGYSQLDFTTRPYPTNANAVTHCVNGSTDYGSIAANRLTYLGTILTDAASAGQVSFTLGTSASGGGACRIGLWNAWNSEPVASTTTDSTASWTYAVSSTWRAADNSTTARCTAVYGINQNPVDVAYHSFVIPGASTAAVSGIGLDSTSAVSGVTGWVQGSGLTLSAIGRFAGYPGAGLHFFSAIEYNSSTTASTWLGVSSPGVTGLIYNSRY